MFTHEDIRRHIDQRPFIPIRIVMSSGQSHDIVDPSMVLVGRRVLIIGTPSADNAAFFEHVVHVSLMHITSVLLIQATPAPSTNGADGQQTP